MSLKSIRRSIRAVSPFSGETRYGLEQEALAEKIHMDIKDFMSQGLTEDQAYHAVAHARHISLREVKSAVQIDEIVDRCWKEHCQEADDFILRWVIIIGSLVWIYLQIIPK